MVLYDKIDKDLAIVQDWVRNHKNLPKIETILLKHFINVCEGNFQEIKKLIELHYNVRASYSHLFIERDPLEKGIQITLDAVDCIYLPELTSENYLIQVSRTVDPDPENYLFVESVKACGMIYDNLFRTIPETQIIDGVINIYDAKGYTLKHLAKVNISAIRGFMKFFEKTIPLKIRQIHVINCPPYMNKILSVLRPFMSDHVNKMMNFYDTKTFEKLFNYVPKNLIPIEFGGTGQSLEILKKKQIQDLKDNRNYLMDPTYWKMKEKDVNQMEGNFKNLNFD